MTHFDLLIVGAGSGNMLLTPDFDDARVAIVERDAFGGTCLNRGCIPSKMFVYAAEIAEHARFAGPRLGLDTSFNGADWAAIRDRVFGRIDPIAAAGERYRDIEQLNVTVCKGTGRFSADHEMTIEMNDGSREIITADSIVLAAGARSFVPDVVATSRASYHTSDTIMRIEKVPEHLIVLGGGYIGSELGNVFGMLGSDVTIINRSSVLLRGEDPDISSRFTDAYSAKFNVMTHSAIEAVDQTDGCIEVTINRAGVRSIVTGDTLLVATGRTPNGDELGLENTAVRLDDEGYVVTDDYLRTDETGIWALGDITNPTQLKHMANAEARIVAHNIANPDDLTPIDRSITPHAVFGHPQVASVGLTEPQTRALGIDYRVAIRKFGDSAYGWAMDDTESVCKLIADSDTRLLIGAHILGPQASTLIQQLIQGMTFGQTVDEMARAQIYIHPALSEVVEQTLLEL